VRRPVATAALAFLLALSHRLLEKHALTREGRWGEKLGCMGYGLTGRTLGIIGFGNIGQEIARLAAPLEMQRIAADPAQPPAVFAEAGVEQVDLDTLLRRADCAIVACALNDATHHLIGERELGLMKDSAFLINIARGPIVDQRALERVLRERRIRGAALDVFDPEPPDPSDPLLRLDNVILAPHAICWTDECFRGIGRSACRGLLDVAAGRVPRYVVNRDALGHPRLRHLRAGGSEQ
jgi:D-3-phosphoglycerate dehydrogenase